MLFGLAEYLKKTQLVLKRLFFNRDRGVYEIDDGNPEGHSGKLTDTIHWAGGAFTAGHDSIAVPPGKVAVITRVTWNIVDTDVHAGTGANLKIYRLTGSEPISHIITDTAQTYPSDDGTRTMGNGSGVIAKSTDNIQMVLVGDFSGGENGDVSVQYYLIDEV